MKTGKVKIGGKEYPCQLTIGAMKEFRNITGKEVDVIDKAPDSEKVDLVMALAYSCIKSVSRREGIELPFGSPDEMSDYIAVNELPDLITGFLDTTDTQAKGEKPKKSKKN
jgi:hypothetical protein